jgi:acylphosphatase
MSSHKRSDTDSRRVVLKITGLVQGVGFRTYGLAEATRLGLTGQIRNLDDGSVEAVVEGPRQVLDVFIRGCRQGPPGSEVCDVTVIESKPRGAFAGFFIEDA